MTAILNKLVSACQTIEANAGSGGGGSGSTYKSGINEAKKANFSGGHGYIPICGVSDNYAEARIYIKVNEETFYRYYIDIVHNTLLSYSFSGFRVFKNYSNPDDGTELSFALVNCSTFDGNMLCLKVSGIDTVISDAFTIFYSYTYNGPSPAIGDSSTYTEESTIDNVQFVPVIPSA